MINVKQIAALSLVALLMVGCGNGKEFNDYAQSIDTSNKSGQEVLVAYFNKKAIDNQNVFKALGQSSDPSQVNNNQMAIVLYTILSQQNDEKLLARFTPKYAEKPTTNADIGKSLADNFLPTLVKWGAGAWLGSKVVDGMTGTSTILGAGSTLSTQSAGNDITSGITNNQTSTINEQTLSNSFNPTGNNEQSANDFQSSPAAEEVVEEEIIEETVLEETVIPVTP